MAWESPAFEYRRQAELALQVVELLGVAWPGLSPESRAELGGLLGQLRTGLAQAAGDASESNLTSAIFQADRQRALAIGHFLAACEGSAAAPGDVKDKLGAAHMPAGRGAPTVSKAQARAIIAAVDLVTPRPAAAHDGDALASAAETFADPLGRTQKLTRWFKENWDALSIEVEDAASQAFVHLGIGLEIAVDDAEREAAAQDFLAEIKAFAPAYEAVERSQAYRKQDRGGSAGENAQKILATLRQHPTIGPAIQAQIESPRETSPALPAAGMASFSMEQPATPTPVSFHTFVDFPAQVTVFDKRIPLFVQLTIEADAESAVDERVQVHFEDPAKTEHVLIVCDAEDFEHEREANTRLIEVYAGSDSQPAVFLLSPKEGATPGDKRITLDFFHRGRPAGSAAFTTALKDRPPLPKADEKAARLTLFDFEQTLTLEAPVAATPDFVLRVKLGGDGKRLNFLLDSPRGLLGYRHKSMGEIPLSTDPRRFLETKIVELSMKARTSARDRKKGETEAFQRDIAKIGWDLYEQLFPQPLKDEWPKIQALGAPGSLSLLLMSDEPWIPWEVVNTPDQQGVFQVDGFLCQQFRMARWLAGPGLPDQLALDSAQLIAPQQTDLKSIRKERGFFTSLGKEAPAIRVFKESLETADQVEKALSGQAARLYHFACHGEFEPGDPDSSGLLLAGKALKPSDIVGPTRNGIKNGRPMIFLNACSSAEADFGLSRVGGWAQRFVSAGVTAFVGSLWEVNDDLAADFALEFYRQILAGKALGEAFYLARQEIKRADPGNPTWLAYVLYAHPNGEVTLGA